MLLLVILFAFKLLGKLTYLINNMKKRTKGAVKAFSVDYNAIDANDTLDIHRYLMKET